MIRKFEDIKPNREIKYIPKKEEVVAPRIYKPEVVVKEKEISEENFFFKKKDKPSDKFLHTRIPKNKKRRVLSGYLVVFLIIALVSGGLYLYSTYFQKANIIIVKKHQEINFKNKQFEATKNKDNNVGFEIMITPGKKMQNVFLTEGDEASTKARGSIILYNEFSQNVERIPSGTFLTNEEGKTYKTDTAVVIPGYKLDTSKKIIPGTIEVKITSFLPGEEYNSSSENFYISPFKNTQKYKKIYGKLKVPLTGGAIGQIYMLDDISKQKLNEIASSSFKNDLFKEAKASIPDGYILYDGAGVFKYSFDENFISKKQEDQIELKGELSVILLREKNLEENIKNISLSELKEDELKEITVPDIKNLEFSFVDSNQIISKDLESISFYLNGKFDAIWNPNSEILKNKLVGINKNDVMTVFRQDPGISSAIVKLSPPWIKYLPNNPSKIKIITQ